MSTNVSLPCVSTVFECSEMCFWQNGLVYVWSRKWSLILRNKFTWIFVEDSRRQCGKSGDFSNAISMDFNSFCFFCRFSMMLDETTPLTIAIQADRGGVFIPQLFYNESSKQFQFFIEFIVFDIFFLSHCSESIEIFPRQCLNLQYSVCAGRSI